MPERLDFDVFLSYHWRDHAQVESLAQRLRKAGLRVFLDRWYLTPGTNWLNALEKTLARCKSVAVCIGAEMGPWQQREQYSALERQVGEERRGVQFPVIPVLLPGAESPLGFLKQNTWVDFRTSADDPVRLGVLPMPSAANRRVRMRSQQCSKRCRRSAPIAACCISANRMPSSSPGVRWRPSSSSRRSPATLWWL